MLGLRFLPAVVWAGLIFFMSAQTRLLPGPEFGFVGADKVAHAGLFSILTGLILFGARFPTGPRGWLCVLLSGLYGVGDEVHQAYVPGRTVDAYDVLADLIGSLVAYFVAVWATRSRPT